VIPLLQANGLHVAVVQNPFTSPADDVALTKRVIAAILMYQSEVGQAPSLRRPLRLPG